MAAHRAPSSRRFTLPGRRAAIAVAVGAGVVLTPLPAFAAAGPVASVAAPSTPIVAPTHAAQVAVNTAMAKLGKPYVWGAAGPNSFDCSGLVQYAYKAAGINLPHSSAAQSQVGKAVSQSALKPGDLVFFYSGPSHVGIYIGNGNVVHAPTTGDVVKVSPMKYMPFNSARRLA
jgi:cell wall-associated NlpC family hydrolase